jgi:hypothetical protein
MKFATALFLALLLTSAFASDEYWQRGITDQRHAITVYRSATCGCCKGWVEHLRQHNFDVEDVSVENVEPYKARFGVPPQAASCHTAVVDGVVIEGHVPAQDIKRLLSSDLKIRLLAVPAMPSGTPGMDTPGAPKHDFKVYAVTEDDQVGIFNVYSDY